MMRKYSSISPVITTMVAALLMAGCSSGASVGNYLWGDDDAPAPAQTRATSQSVNPALPDAPAVSTYSYTASAAPGEDRAGFSKLPKNSQRVFVIVNDQPITGYDISQRTRLNKILGKRGLSRKDILKELIDDVIQISAAKQNKVNIDDKRIDAAIASMASSTGSSPGRLRTQLKKQGVAFSSLKQQVKASLALRWLMQKNKASVGKVTDADIDRALRKVNSDPRRQGVTVYLIRQVNLPVEQTSSAMAPQLLQARAIEAQQISRRYKGCSSLRSASSGIYNVKLTRTIQADSRKLPPQMRSSLRKAGTRRLIGPMRTNGGIQMIAFCGTKRIEPPKITRAQAKNFVENEKFGNAADNILKGLRRKAFIDYKVASARP